MKNILLFLAVFFGLISFSQAQISKESYRKYMKKPIEPVQSKVVYPKKDIKLPSKSNDAKNNISRIPIGKSPNAYSILNSEQRPLFYFERNDHPISKYVQYVFEPDPENYDDVEQEGGIMSTYSELEGDDHPSFNYWEENLLVDNLNKISNPSAVLIRAEGSVQIEEYYSIISGKDSLDDSSSNTAFLSSQINNNNYQENIYNWESENDWAQSSMTVKEDEVYIFGQDFENIGEFGNNQSLKQYRGITDNIENGFNWEINTVNPDWLIDPEEGFAYALYTTWSAWSNDGSIGYMWMIGVTNDSYEYGVYQPQVYYTTDKGGSWNPIELNLENHEVLVDFLQPWLDENGNPGTVRPSFISGDNNFPGAVDRQGRLNLFSNVYGSTTGDVLNPAESNWINPEELGGCLFDFIIDPEGINRIVTVGRFKTKVSTNSFGNIGFDHRLQVGSTYLNDAITVIWVDDEISDSDSLVNTDIYAWNICDGVGDSFNYNLTEDHLYSGFFFFPYLAENFPYIYGLGLSAQLPISISVSFEEYMMNNPSQPISHFFLNKIMVSPVGCYFNGTNDLDNNQSQIIISQNTPNPFSGETKIEITSSFQEPKEVSIEITDLLGHTVYQSSEGKIEEVKEISINAKDLKPGVYFYTISLGEECQTKKMIVE